jgi:carbamoyl-phosphate synthase large subunit
MPHLIDNDISQLIDECHKRSVTIVLPTRDGELDFWSYHRDRFAKAGIEVIISSQEAIKRCRDKLEFAHYGLSADLPIIPTALSPEQFPDQAFLVVKERFGSGSRDLGLNLTHDQAKEHAKQLEQPIFQPFIAGEEISIDSWIAKNGDVAGVVLRRRDRVISGESQVTTTFRDASIEAQAMQVIASLQSRGPVVLQAIVSDGVLQVIECNPRFGGASTASIAVGLDSLYWSLAEAVDSGFQAVFHRSSHEVRQVRTPVDLLIHDSHF